MSIDVIRMVPINRLENGDGRLAFARGQVRTPPAGGSPFQEKRGLFKRGTKCLTHRRGPPSSRKRSPKTAAETEAEATEWEARFNAQLAALSPEERAEHDKLIAADQEPGIRLDKVLRRLGFQDGLGERRYSNLRKAMSAAGFSLDELASMGPFDMLAILEPRAKVLDGIKARGLEKASALVRKKSGMMGGRPKGETRLVKVDGELPRNRRGDKKTQADFARQLRIKRTTYRRAEVEGLATEKTAIVIAGRLNLDLQELVPIVKKVAPKT